MQNVNPSTSRFATTLFTLAMLAAFGLHARAQQDAKGQDRSARTQQPIGLPDDWSHHRVIFPDAGKEEDAIRNGTHEHWLQVTNDSRYMIQQLKRNKARHPEWRAPIHDPSEWRDRGKDAAKPALQADWSMSMGATSAVVGGDNFPAKYSFSVAAPTSANCAGGSAPDFVVYNTSTGGSTTQASIVAYDNLYPGLCTGDVPQVYWSYDTGGTIETSPVLSLDGKQLAFVHSSFFGASLVLLKWAATTVPFTGTTHSTTSVTAVSSCTGLTTVGTPVYGPNIPAGDVSEGCTGTTLTLSIAATSNATGETLTYSSSGGPNAPFNLTTGGHTVTPANYRNCTAPCMTTISFGTGSDDTISSPYYDYANDVIYVGDAGGNLLKFSNVFLGNTTPILSWTLANAGNQNITSPVCDANCAHIYWTNYNTYLAYTTPAGGTFVQTANTNYTSGNDIAETPVLDGTNGKIYLFAGGDYINRRGPLSCVGMGTVGTGGVGNTSGNAVGQYATGFAANASPLMVDCFGTGSGTNPLYEGDFDNNFFTTGTGNLYECGNTGGRPILYQIPITAGQMGAVVNTGPTLTSGTTLCSPVTEVYNSAVTNGPYDWLYLGLRANGSPTGCGDAACVVSLIVTQWQPSTVYAVGQEILDTNLNIQKVTAVTGADKSGATHPTWTVTTTADNNVTWTYQGNMLAESVGLPYSGGTSGISIDNITSTTNGASNLYFSTLGSETCVTSGGAAGGCAVQLTQQVP